MPDLVVQRVVMPLGPSVHRLYLRSGKGRKARPRGRRSALLLPGAALRTDTWFNALYEPHWRQHTALDRLELRVWTSGAGQLRVLRRTAQGDVRRIGQARLTGVRKGVCLSVSLPASQDECGLLFFELRARTRLVLYRAEWVARATSPRPVRLNAIYCTCDRETLLLQNVAALHADRGSDETIERILVVDQGTRDLRDHLDFPRIAALWGDRLTVLRQGNFGGAGGFSRGLIEALAMRQATHALLLDDDAVIEAESVARAATFLALARDEVAVGGHMLDQSRPRELVGGGCRYVPQRLASDLPSRTRVDRPGDLTQFLATPEVDYNGWWFLALPLSAIRRAGLPLPLFLRGDDVELGRRLRRAGVPTVPLPGVAVWHVPFEAKARGWQPYYELRNLLVVGALHFPRQSGASIARRFLSRLLDELLAYDYWEAWLLCQGALAFLRGPRALCQGVRATHRRLVAARSQRAPASASLVRQPVASTPRPPRKCLATRLRRWWQVVRNLVCRSPGWAAQPTLTVRPEAEQWYALAGHDVVAVIEDADKAVVLRRSRARFIPLMLQGLWVALRLALSYCRTARRWQQEAPTMTGPDFWRAHLGLPAQPESPGQARHRPVNSQRAVSIQTQGAR